MILTNLNLHIASIPPTIFQFNFGDVIWKLQNGCHLEYLNGTIVSIQSLNVVLMPPTKGWPNWTLVWEVSFKEFQDSRCGGHLGYWNRSILAILISMLPRCFNSNEHVSKGDVILILAFSPKNPIWKYLKNYLKWPIKNRQNKGHNDIW